MSRPSTIKTLSRCNWYLHTKTYRTKMLCNFYHHWDKPNHRGNFCIFKLMLVSYKHKHVYTQKPKMYIETMQKATFSLRKLV